MQEDKTKVVDAALGDEGSRFKKLSVGEVMRLFGPVQEGEDGKEFIVVDPEDEHNDMPLTGLEDADEKPWGRR
jgi:hypothetical protein